VIRGAAEKRSNTRLAELLAQLQNVSVRIRVVPDLHEYVTLGCRVDSFEGLPILRLDDSPMDHWGGLAKRVVDIVLSAVGLVVLSPLPCPPCHSGQGHIDRPCPVCPRADGARRSSVRDVQVSARCVSTQRLFRGGLGQSWRFSTDADRRIPPSQQPRRAASAMERAGGRHVARGAAARAPRLCGSLPKRDPRIHAAAQGQGGHHRVGAGQRLARGHLSTRSDRL